ncbi:MAG: NAD(+) diphosphatase [Sphingomonadales bacterium]|nr:MAG: NAD(+) diphosphatase [Sphingomonadales bacterium]
MIGFTGNTLNRGEALRRDEAALAALAQHAASRLLPFVELDPLVHDNELGWVPLLEAPVQEGVVFLGLDADGVAHFTAMVAADSGLPGSAVNARAAAQMFGDNRAAIIAHARALLGWHAHNRFCARCGAPSQPMRGGAMRTCSNPDCATQHFPRVDPVVIMLAVDGDRCLLGRQAQFPPAMYSALAGFVEPGESIEEAVAREVAEEAGIGVANVRYVASQPWPFASSLMIGCIADATTTDVRIDPDELEDARWFSRAEVRDALRKEGPLKVPPSIALANTLLRHWA